QSIAGFDRKSENPAEQEIHERSFPARDFENVRRCSMKSSTNCARFDEAVPVASLSFVGL
ncbi:MAG TPA: hypothetical protein VK148_29435, partial [Xanthobacteraceae bacterium]|nr:hypothetical protein [Xanthobacteraceae bacterium]